MTDDSNCGVGSVVGVSIGIGVLVDGIGVSVGGKEGVSVGIGVSVARSETSVGVNVIGLGVRGETSRVPVEVGLRVGEVLGCGVGVVVGGNGAPVGSGVPVEVGLRVGEVVGCGVGVIVGVVRIMTLAANVGVGVIGAK